MRRRILAVGIMMLFLVGCSNESNAQAAHPDGKDETASVGHWDPNEWKPTVQITRPVLSGEEKDRLRREVARQHVSDPNLKEKLPDVPVVAYLDSFREYEKKHAQCVTDAGFSAKALESGGISYGDYPQSQGQAFQMAAYTCHMKYPFDPALARDWTPEQVGLVYDYWNEYMIPCLDAHGYPTDVSKRPSRESYIQNFFAEDGSGRQWYPTGLQPSLEHEGGHDDVLKVCPALPPSDTLYGVAH
ncbi:hypothetical protein [Trueperella pyogenes]|uniref:hypothetical protein n=1 Tax=Trueperella pyogenes TaxID=1661 RepID=UPI000F89CC28|nr:hypothetical protein [Trueperella pyogenes]MCI7690542.1 hypothetical protein [Trueperella pyogenes]